MPALALRDRLCEKLAVRLESDRADEARLSRTQQVSRAANLEVAHRHLQAAAEVGELANRLEARLSIVAQGLVRLVQQIRVGLMVRAPDPPAQLVKLGQAEAVRIVDDDRIDVGNVDAVLDDRRRHQDVDLAVDEARHHGLQFSFAHLPVADRDAGFRDELLERASDPVNALDAVVKVVDLAAAIQLLQDRLLHDRVGRWDDHRLDRHAVLRRRLNQREVAHAEQRHVQRARNRRGRER